MNIEFYGKIKNGIFLLNNPKTFSIHTRTLKDGDYYLELHRNQGTMKTLEQLGYFHAVVVPTVMNQIIADGNEFIIVKIGKSFKEVPITEDVVINLLKSVWAKTKGVEVKSKADMTEEEFSELIDISIRWSARFLHCIIPPPDTEGDKL